MAALPVPGAGALASTLLSDLSPSGAMRFEVSIDKGWFLGSWTKCDGLQASFDNQTAIVNGQRKIVPGVAKGYKDVTLKRPVTAVGCKEVKRWLEEYQSRLQKVTATIRLLNAHGGEVLKWELSGVVPSKWELETLEVSSTNLAMEKLEIQFDGFLESARTNASHFEVIIDHDHNLGAWSTCEHLQVGMAVSKDAGKTVGDPILVTDPPTYQDVVLTRRFTTKGWEAVRKWLVKQAGGPPTTGHSATITLHSYDDLDHGLTRKTPWTLQDVAVTEWTVSKFDAEKTLNPTETLKLAHRGFLHTETELGVKRPSLSDRKGTRIEFAGEPTNVTLTCGQTFTPWKRAIPKGHGPSRTAINQFAGAEKSRLDVTVPLIAVKASSGTASPRPAAGRSTTIEDQIKTLESWSGRPVTIGAHRPGASPSPPPEVTFTWGDQRFTGYITRLTVEEVKERAGKSYYARVRILMQEQLPEPKSQNPTSGGLSGGRATILGEGDSLQSVAFGEYGHAARWRQLAEANGVDDPLRVAPGTRLLLPPDL